jgi:hypothetical protein
MSKHSKHSKHSRRSGPDALTVELSRLEAAVARLRRKEARARRKAERLGRKIDTMRDAARLAPVAAVDRGAADGDRPTGVHAIRLLVEEDATRVWSARELCLELLSRGWVSPCAAHRLRGVEAVLSRLVRRGELTRVRPGRYRRAAEGALPKAPSRPEGLGGGEAVMAGGPDPASAGARRRPDVDPGRGRS